MASVRIAFLFPLLLLGACTAPNAFLENYVGERMPPVASASVVADQPPADAKEIGTASFQSRAGGLGDAQATAAAMQVGADLVQWKREFLAREDWVENDPVYERRAAGQGQFSSYIPIPGSRERWTYTARFWRSPAAVPAPAGAKAASVTSSPGQAPAAAAAAPSPAPAPSAPAAPSTR